VLPRGGLLNTDMNASWIRVGLSRGLGAVALMGFALVPLARALDEPKPPDVQRFVKLGDAKSELAVGKELFPIKVTEKPLDQVLEFLSQVSRLNIKTINEKDGKIPITLDLENVTYRGVLDFITKKYGLMMDDSKIAQNIIIVTSPPKVSMLFSNADIRDVINTIASQAGANIVIGPEITGQISMRLENIPWRDALNIVVKTLNFVAVPEVGDTIRITTPDRLSTQLETRIFKLSYLTPDSAKYVATLVSEFAKRQESEKAAAAGQTLLDVLLGMVTPGTGSINYVKRGTSLVVTDTATKLESMQNVVTKLDVPPKQIFVSVKIVAITDIDLERLGVNWSNGIQFAVTPVSNWPTSFPFDSQNGLSRSILGNWAVNNSRFRGVSDIFSLRRAVASGVSPYAAIPTLAMGNMGFTSPNGPTSLFFEAIRTKTNTRVIQTPQLMTLDNEEATIQVGQLFRYAESFVANTEGGGNVAGFREASGSPVKLGLQLLIIPHVTGPENNVLMTVIPKTEDLDRVDSFQGPDGSVLQLPQTTQRIVVTRMLLRNEETGVIAGLRINRERRVDAAVPIFSSIPIIGRLFRHRIRDGGVASNGTGQPTSESLMIFVTPSIVDAIEGRDNFKQQLEKIRSEVSRTFAPLGEDHGESASPERSY